MRAPRAAAERPRGGSRSRAGLAAAAAGLALTGFAVGAAAGLVWEAPGLVAAHLLGRGEEVPLASAGGAPEAEPAEPAERPLGARGGASEEGLPAVGAGAPERGAAPEPAATPRKAAAGEPGFAVQVGAFADAASARALAGGLREAGLPVYVREGGEGGARHRVRVGPLASREEAERVAERLRSVRGLPTWILARESD